MNPFTIRKVGFGSNHYRNAMSALCPFTRNQRHVGFGTDSRSQSERPKPTLDAIRRHRAGSFDHLVGGSEQGGRHTQPKSSGCVLVDLKLVFDRLLDGQIARIGTFQDAISV